MGRRSAAAPAKERVGRDVDTTPDTCSLSDACQRFGISPTLGGRLARAGEGSLCEGVGIIRFGSAASDRPIYRVSIAQIEARLAAR